MDNSQESQDSQDPRCNTCKAIFSSVDKAKEHYRSDWHVFNSKRRGNGLVPLSKDDYKRVKPLIPVKDHKIIVVPVAEKKIPEVESIQDNQTSDVNVEENLDDEDDIAPELLEATVSIFDNKVFPTVDECIEHMALLYGFFIPDIEYLTDVESFLKYLNEKVKVGHVCLYCQKQFRKYVACQHHMISKSHCKIAYEEDVDLVEFEDFFDFSESYQEEEEYDENGVVIEKSLEISPIGELVLPSGRTVGHRAYLRYYKQKFRPEESRKSVLAVQREELLRLGNLKFGGEYINKDELLALTDIQVMTMLVQKQREIRKNQVITERIQQKRDFIDQRREYKSTVDKLRSSATTTAKIRDYHSRLV